MAEELSDQTYENENEKTVDVVEYGVESEEVVAPATKLSSIMTVVASGVALFSDGYTASVVGYTNLIFKELYPKEFTSTLSGRMSNAYLIGEIIGMLGFGILIDRIGRKTGILIATVMLVLGIVLTTAAHGTSITGMIWMVIIARGISGVGAGGEYPVCGTGATEASDEGPHVRKNRGFLVGLVCDFAIDLGFVVSGIVVLIVLAAYHQKASQGIWRISFGIGLVLPLSVLYFRLKMLNSTQFKKHAIRRKVPYMLLIKRYWKPLLGTSLAWFMYDFVSYPFGLFSSTIISDLNPNNTIVQNIGFGTVINLFDLPGAFIGGYLMDKIGRKNTMMAGFFSQALLGFIIGGALVPISGITGLFIVLYGIFVALGEMGPGVATFLVSAESFPTPFRGHMLGFSAAVGKAGASIGTQVFTPIQTDIGGNTSSVKGQQGVFLVGSAFSIVGGLITYFLIPKMDRNLESEDAKFKQYLQENGWDVSDMGFEE